MFVTFVRLSDLCIYICIYICEYIPIYVYNICMYGTFFCITAKIFTQLKSSVLIHLPKSSQNLQVFYWNFKQLYFVIYIFILLFKLLAQFVATNNLLWFAFAQNRWPIEAWANKRAPRTSDQMWTATVGVRRRSELPSCRAAWQTIQLLQPLAKAQAPTEGVQQSRAAQSRAVSYSSLKFIWTVKLIYC